MKERKREKKKKRRYKSFETTNNLLVILFRFLFFFEHTFTQKYNTTFVCQWRRVTTTHVQRTIVSI